MENRLFILLCLLWGSTWMFIKVGLASFPPLIFGGLRYIIATIFLYIVMKCYRLPLPTKWEDIKPAVIFGTLNGLSCALIYWGEQFLSSSLSAILNTTTPLFMAVFAYIFLHEEMNKYKIAGLLLGFAGIVVIFSSNLELDASSFWGAVAMVVQAAIYALGATHSKKYPVNIRPLQVVTIQLIAAAVELTLLGIILERQKPVVISVMGVISLIYLAIFGASLAFLIYYYLLTKIDVTRLSYISFITPVIAAVEGVAFLKEPLTFRMVAGLALSLLGAYVVNVLAVTRKAEEE